jgi:hypothetical protein
MPVALHPNQISLFVLKAEQGLSPDKQTRFKIRPIPEWLYFDLARESQERFAAMAKAQPTAVETLDASLESAEETSLEAVAPASLEWTREYAPYIHKLLRIGLGGWDNFKDADGKDAPFETGPDGYATDATLCRLAWFDQVEIGQAVMACNQAPPERLGN